MNSFLQIPSHLRRACLGPRLSGLYLHGAGTRP